VAHLPLDDLLRLSPHAGSFVVDLNVELGVLGWRSNRRLIAPAELSEAVPFAEDPQRAAFYATNMGNLSLRLTRPAALSPRPRPSLRQRLRPRRVARALRRRLSLRHWPLRP
jgi:hypothetical protein